MSPADHQAMLAGLRGRGERLQRHRLRQLRRLPLPQAVPGGQDGDSQHQRAGVPTSWFVGWGPLADPQYLIAVVIEKGGYGASAAAPVVRRGFNYLVAHPVSPGWT